MRTCDGGGGGVALWEAVSSQLVGERTPPAAWLGDLHPRRASGRGLGCGCELQEAHGAHKAFEWWDHWPQA